MDIHCFKKRVYIILKVMLQGAYSVEYRIVLVHSRTSVNTSYLQLGSLWAR